MVNSPRLVFREVEAENLLSYRRFKVPLADQGLVNLRGPNGSGKSTIPSAIDYAIFSDTSRGLRYSKLVNLHAKSDLWLKLTVDVEGVEHVIEHIINVGTNRNEISVHQAGQLVTGTMKIPDIRRAIPEMLGVDRIGFLSSVYLSQEHHHILVSGKPKEKERYVMELFGLTIYNDLIAKSNVRSRRLDQGDDVKQLQAKVRQIKERLKDLPVRDKAEKRLKSYRTQRANLKDQLKLLQTRLSKLIALKAKIDIRGTLVTKLKDLEVEEVPTADDLRDLQDKVDRLGDTVADTKSKLTHARRAREIESELTQYHSTRLLDEIRTDIEKAQSQRTLLIKVKLPEATRAKVLRLKQAKVTKPKNPPSYYEDRVADAETQVKYASARVKKYTTQLRKGTCPTCKRPWDLTAAEISEIREKLETSRGTLEQSTKDKSLVQTRLDSARTWETLEKGLKGLPTEDPGDLEFKARKILRTIKDLQAERGVAEKRKELETLVSGAPSESVEDLEDLLKTSQRQLKKTRENLSVVSEAKQLLDQISKLPSDDIATVKANGRQTKQSLQEGQEEQEDLAAKVTETKRQLEEVEDLQGQLVQLESELSKSRKDQRDAVLWGIIRDGFSHILRRREKDVLARLLDKVPAYMRPLFGKDTKWLSADLSKEADGIDLKLRTRGKALPANAISVGQRTKLGLCSVFALRDLYDTGSNLLVLDEPLMGVDARGIEGFVDIVREVRGKVGTLILISHEPDIKGLTFDNVWRTSIDNGQSRIAL